MLPCVTSNVCQDESDSSTSQIFLPGPLICVIAIDRQATSRCANEAFRRYRGGNLDKRPQKHERDG